METSHFDHIPVMIDQVVELAHSLPSGHFADLTLGGAGHGSAILESNAGLVLHGFDRDGMAVEASHDRLVPFGARARVYRSRFDHAADELRRNNIESLSGFFMDLGVSSPQLDTAERGFSFRLDGPLDMRMDTSQRLSAADVVNTYSASELRDVLVSYGDERNAGRIVSAIMASRPITRTRHLAEVVEQAVPAAVRRKSQTHPATRTFQALRIEVNDELAILGETIESMIAMLGAGGIGMVLTYHSGEDRIVKDRMRVAIDGEGPAGFPSSTPFEWAFRGARTPNDSEIDANPRARSARLRAVRKVEP